MSGIPFSSDRSVTRRVVDTSSLVSFMPFSGDRSDTCVSAHRSPSAACPSAATGRTPSCSAVQVRQLHVLQRRQVGHLRVTRNPGPSAACPSAATGRTPACCRSPGSSASCPFSGDRSDTCVPWQSKPVSFMSFSGDRSDTWCAAAGQVRQLHALQRRQVRHTGSCSQLP